MMRITNDDFNVGDIYQFMAGENRKYYEPMPFWDLLMNKLSKRAKQSRYCNVSLESFSPIEAVHITESPFEDNINAIDLIIIINSTAFLSDDKINPFRNSICNINFEKTNKIIFGEWRKYKTSNPQSRIDRVILIDNGVTISESPIEGQKICMELYKNYYGTINDIAIGFTSNSFHQQIGQRYYFGEEFREYIDSSSTDIDDAICGYVSCLILLYVMDISYRNNIEAILYNAVGNIMREIEESEDK